MNNFSRTNTQLKKNSIFHSIIKSIPSGLSDEYCFLALRFIISILKIHLCLQNEDFHDK